MAALSISLGTEYATNELEPWTTPDLLAYAKAEESVDLLSVCKVASQILYLLSGRRFGVRTETIRPFSQECGAGWQRSFIPSNLWAFAPVSLGEPGPRYLELKSPVQEITSIRVDGEVLDASDYRLYDGKKLFRSDGACWPSAQNMDLANTEAGTFEIVFKWGTPVPEGGLMAAQVFATELSKYINKENCAFPDRTISFSRQGVSGTLLDASQFFKEAKTGLFMPDLWLSAVCPNGNRKRPTITSPESVIQASVN